MKLTQQQKDLQKMLKEDYKMFFIVRTDLKMGKGKIGSQIGHCTIGLYDILLEKNNLKMLNSWKMTGQKKIVGKLKTEKDLNNIILKANKLNIINHKVYDAGKTQIKENSLTVIGFFGKSKQLNQILHNIKLL